MKKIDFMALDGRSLRTFLVVFEEMSISNAANRLGVTQSAVSHLLDKLRLTLGDPLFVRAGRGIAPTERAVTLREPVQAVLDGLKALTDKRPFDPAVGQLEYTIAANDFQRDLIFPDLVRALATEGVDALFRFIPSGIPATDLLRQARCQLIVTPFPPEGPDIYQTRLFDDHIVCFFDGSMRTAPTSKDEFCAADYIEVRFEDDETAMQVLHSSTGLDLKGPRLSVPNFSALAAFLKGSDLISAQLSLMGKVNLQGFAFAPLPFETGTATMYMAWHRRDHMDPAHQWLRNRIKALVDQIL
jgi:DNA-binding transcriptional LysR family regulator